MKSSKKSVQKKSSKKESYLDDWKAIVSSSNLQEDLVKHFSYLADSPGSDNVLSQVMKKATAARIAGKNLEVILNGESMVAAPPMNDIPSHYPKSFAKLLRKHETVTFYRVLGEHNKFRIADGWFEEPEDLNEQTQPFADADDFICPIADPDGDFWIYHPQKKKSDGEPVICFLNHESGEIDYEETIDAGSVFLASCAKLLKLKVTEKIKRPKKTSKGRTQARKKTTPITNSGLKTDAEYQQWWDALDKNWKIFFKRKWKISSPDLKGIKDLLRADTICLETKDNIKTLEPLRSMTNLEVIQLHITSNLDFSPLLELTKVLAVHLDFTPITSLSFLRNMENLKGLRLNNTSVTDISDVVWFKKLDFLDLSGTPIENIDVLSKLPRLDLLRIYNTKITIESMLKLQESNNRIRINSDLHYQGHEGGFKILIKYLKTRKPHRSSTKEGELLAKLVISEIERYKELKLDHVDKLITAYQPFVAEIPKHLQDHFEKLKEQRVEFKKAHDVRKT